jgi:hypothetical protein
MGELVPSLRILDSLDAKADLGKRHAAHIEFAGASTRNPFFDASVALRFTKLGEHVGVE